MVVFVRVLVAVDHPEMVLGEDGVRERPGAAEVGRPAKANLEVPAEIRGAHFAPIVELALEVEREVHQVQEAAR